MSESSTASVLEDHATDATMTVAAPLAAGALWAATTRILRDRYLAS
jgi:hypothetical protein